MPPLNIQNGIDQDEIPEELELTPLEKQLIAKNLYFLKVRKLTKTQMDVFNDRVINVPLEDEDLLKTSRSLPRSENNGAVPINLKRKLDLKSCHKCELTRPKKIYESHFWLKKNHPSYRDIAIKDYETWMNETIFDCDTNETEEELSTSDFEDTESISSSENVAQNKSKAVEEKFLSGYMSHAR